MLTIRAEAEIQAPAAVVWLAWKPAYPISRRKDEARNLHLYPLAYGLQIPVTLVAVDELHGWTLEHALPAGKVVIDHRLDPVPGGGVLASETYAISGPMSALYRLLAGGIRSSARARLKELATTCQSRTTTARGRTKA